MIGAGFILASLVITASAANDWTKPCTSGTCSYDVPESKDRMAASMTISGSPFAISDITKAAGWEIIGCKPDALAQDIRVVCIDETLCNHLFKNGAVGTIVRLPENCGKMAFARVAKAVDSSDQSLPADVAHRLRKRATPPVVKSLALDTDFGAGANNGEVTLTIQGASMPGAMGDFTPAPAAVTRNRLRSLSPKQARELQRRGFLSFIKKAINKFIELDSFEKSVSTDLPPIDFNRKLPIFNSSIDCGAIKADIDINVDAKAHAEISVGVVAAGTLIPPMITDFAVYSGLTADMTGSLNIDSRIIGTLDTGVVTLYQAGIPGLSFPGILTVGPSFKLNAQAKTNLDVELDTTVSLNYKVNKLQMVFPPVEGTVSKGSSTPGDAALTLSASNSVVGKGNIETHLIPTLDLGINALGGIATATVFLQVDTSANLSLNFTAAADGLVSTNGQKNGSASAGGCAGLDMGIDINAGANGAFLGIFNAKTSVPIFKRDFQVFEKCFSSATKNAAAPAAKAPAAKAAAVVRREQRRTIDHSGPSAELMARDEPMKRQLAALQQFTCVTAPVTGLLAPLLEQVVSGASILPSTKV